MTIRIKKDKIEFVDDASGNTFTLKETGTGFTFDGTITSWDNLGSRYAGQGAGYFAGGSAGAPGAFTTIIDKWSLTSDGGGTNIGNLSQARYAQQGLSSTTKGYAAGGYSGPTGTVTTFERYPFATNSSSTALTSLGTARRWGSNAGIVYTGAQYGFLLGGTSPSTNTFNTRVNFASDGALALAGSGESPNTYDSTIQDGGRGGFSAVSSPTHGYLCGGYNYGPAPASPTNNILKFSFIYSVPETYGYTLGAPIWYSPTATTPSGRHYGNGFQSDTSGIIWGGASPAGPGEDKKIMRFPFANDNVVSYIGDAPTPMVGANGSAAITSITDGYVAGGGSGSPYLSSSAMIRWPFASEVSVVGIGNLSTAHAQGSPGQV
jgi:hypothetical protein